MSTSPAGHVLSTLRVLYMEGEGHSRTHQRVRGQTRVKSGNSVLEKGRSRDMQGMWARVILEWKLPPLVQNRERRLGND